jgi:hypothetical protein
MPVPLETLARAYLRAYDRLHDAMRDGIADAGSEQTFFCVFETLNWLDSLLSRNDAGLVKEGDGSEAGELIAALRFVRGHVHHRWVDAIELRSDVRHPPVVLGLHTPSASIVQFQDPNIYTDWCWVATTALVGSRDRRDPARRKAYERQLAG